RGRRRARGGGAPDQRGPRRDPRAPRPDRGHVRGAPRRGGRARDDRGDRVADGRRGVTLRLERRLVPPWWLAVAVAVGSLAVAFAIMAVVLVLTGHSPGHTYRRLFDAAFVGSTALSNTLISATPLLFTGLAAAIAFRMQIFNIGGEGQLYFGCIGAA